MRAEGGHAAIGCLYIGEITSGTSVASGRFLFRGAGDIAVHRFRCRDGEDLWDALRDELQTLRATYGTAFIVGLGTGCAAALALSVQLPVERLVLIDPVLMPGSPRALSRAQSDRWHENSGPVRRLARFARRNLFLCASEILVVERDSVPSGFPDRTGSLSPCSRLTRLCLRRKSAGEMCINGENTVNQAISGFLKTGELPKPLAENPEMCIIYE